MAPGCRSTIWSQAPSWGRRRCAVFYSKPALFIGGECCVRVIAVCMDRVGQCGVADDRVGRGMPLRNGRQRRSSSEPVMHERAVVTIVLLA